jgi:AraC family transcriptional activator of mtrCDE
LAPDRLNQLISTLDVRMHAFSICEIASGVRLSFAPMDTPIIHFVLAGSGSLEAGSGAVVRFEAPAVVIVPRAHPQRILAGEIVRHDLDAAKHCSLMLDGLIRFDGTLGGPPDLRLICAAVSTTYAGTLGLFDGLEAPLVERIGAENETDWLLNALIMERDNPQVGAHAVIESVMKVLLVALIRAQVRQGVLASPLLSRLIDPRLANAVALVLRDPAAVHSLDDLTRAAGMSRSAFVKAFKASFGQTPMDFVQQTRLRDGARLLANTDVPIQVIASSLGYSSRGRFSRAFKHVYGVGPSDYRSRNGG